MKAATRRGMGLAGVMALALVLLVLTGRAAVLARAPSTEECVELWNGALDNGTASVDVQPQDVLLASQGAADWNGQYPVCWLTIVDNDHTCQSFHTLAGNANRWGSDPIDTCDTSTRPDNSTALGVSPDGRMAIRER